jgi:hypothetical protein
MNENQREKLQDFISVTNCAGRKNTASQHDCTAKRRKPHKSDKAAFRPVGGFNEMFHYHEFEKA